jgi:hypothetical protein
MYQHSVKWIVIVVIVMNPAKYRPTKRSVIMSDCLVTY